MRFRFWASSIDNECPAKGNLTQIGEEERGHRRKKNPMDAKWGHGRAEAACRWHDPRWAAGGITTIRGASINLNESLGCN